MNVNKKVHKKNFKMYNYFVFDVKCERENPQKIDAKLFKQRARIK